MMPCSRTLDARCWGHNIPCNKEGGREREPWWEINKIRCDLIWSRHLVTGWWSWRAPRVHVCRIIFLYRYTLHYIFIHVRKMCARVMEWVIWPHEEPSGIFERTSVFTIRGSFTFSCQTLESKFTPPIHVILTKQANPSPWLVVMIFLIALQHHCIRFPRWTNYWFIRIPIWPIRKHLIRYSLFSSSMLGPSQAANPPEADFFTDPTGYAQASSSDHLQRPPMQVSWIMHSHLKSRQLHLQRWNVVLEYGTFQMEKE